MKKQKLTKSINNINLRLRSAEAMKKLTCLITLSLINTISLSAFAETGVGSGAGGQAVLCYQSEKTKDQVIQDFKARSGNALPLEVDLRLEELSQKPVLRDFYEYGGARGLETVSETSPQEVTYDQVMAKLKNSNPQFHAMLQPYVTTSNQWIVAPSGVVELADTTFTQRFAGNCLIVQFARYDDKTGLISYDKRIRDKMDKVQLVALRLHEEIYKFYRESVIQLNNHYNQYANGRQYEFLKPWGEEKNWNRPLFAILTRIHTAGDGTVFTSVTSDTVRPLVGYLVGVPEYNHTEIRDMAVTIAVSVKLVDWSDNGMLTTFPIYQE